MKIHLSKPINGRIIIEAFKSALCSEPRSEDDHNRKWVADEYKDEIHYSLSGREKVASTTCVGIVAQLEQALMDSWHKAWPVEVRDVRLLPLNPQMDHTEVTIQVGMIPFAQEAVHLDRDTPVSHVLHGVMERFNKKLFEGLRAAA
ncbi:MAG TPA: hypothetical protein VHD31_01645 [Candidatus Paceibacterota bacterium]|nr:hypothetical protein [Candidatus Paceibacterota bacterium]